MTGIGANIILLETCEHELAILTAAGFGETSMPDGLVFDVGKAIWTIPAVGMAAGHEHRLPLSARYALVEPYRP